MSLRILVDLPLMGELLNARFGPLRRLSSQFPLREVDIFVGSPEHRDRHPDLASIDARREPMLHAEHDAGFDHEKTETGQNPRSIRRC